MNFVAFPGIAPRAELILLWLPGLMCFLFLLLIPRQVWASDAITLTDRSISAVYDDGYRYEIRSFAPADTSDTDSSDVQADSLRPSGVNPAFGNGDEQDADQRSFSEDDAIPPMEARISAGFHEVFNDSLLRWEQWFNLAERQSYRRGVMPYRLGALGRNDARLIRAVEPRHQVFALEGISLNDPVSGSMNSNFLPLERMRYYAERSEGIRYEGDAELLRFHVNKPLTWINFEETADNERRAGVLLTRNITQRGNLELTFRGNNHDGTYRRTELSGRQASARYSHYLNDSWLGQAYLLYNSQQIQQPGGYEVGNPFLFGFVPLQTTASVADGRSSVRNTHLGLSLYHRPESDRARRSRIHAYHQRYRRLYSGDGRNTFSRVFSYGFRGDTRIKLGGISFHPYTGIRHSYENQDEESVLSVSGWTDLKTGTHVQLQPARFAELSGWARLHYRSDSGSDPGYEAGYRIDFRPENSLKFYQSLAVGQLVGHIQQRYWDGDAFAGTPELRQEQIARAEAGLSWSGGWLHEAGLRAYTSNISSPIVISPEAGSDGRRSFINIDAYQSLGGEIYADIRTKRIETGLSSSLHQYESNSGRAENMLLTGSGLRNINRAYFYLKRYFFDFASFAKVGAIATFSANSIQSSQYYEGLDYWDPIPEATPVPDYYRVDLEASARVRMLMVLLRYENIFDQLGQAGYFETARYPMPSRRFRLGIRWILRN